MKAKGTHLIVSCSNRDTSPSSPHDLCIMTLLLCLLSTDARQQHLVNQAKSMFDAQSFSYMYFLKYVCFIWCSGTMPSFAVAVFCCPLSPVTHACILKSVHF